MREGMDSPKIERSKPFSKKNRPNFEEEVSCANGEVWGERGSGISHTLNESCVVDYHTLRAPITAQLSPTLR